MKPWIVGLTGRSGCGKSTVSEHYRAKGYAVLDCDRAAREVAAPGSSCLNQLVQAFGSEIVDAEGRLQRRTLARKAFSSEEGTARLTQITHPAIIALLVEQAEQAFSTGAEMVFADGAVIVGHSFEAYCQRIIVVDAPDDVCVARIMKRDEIDREAAVQRLAAQMSSEQLRKAADYVIENHADRMTLLQQADQVLQELRKERNEHREKSETSADCGTGSGAVDCSDPVCRP